MLELECCDAIHRQSLRLAIEAAQWGSKKPRRWLARWGGLTLARGENADDLNAEYREHRKRIAALVPKNKISPEWF